MLTVTAPVGHRAAHGPQYQHSSTYMYALPLSGWIASESSGQMSTHSVHPSMHSDASMVTGTSLLLSTKGTRWAPVFADPLYCHIVYRFDRHMLMGVILHWFLPTNGDSRTDLSLGNAVGAAG